MCRFDYIIGMDGANTAAILKAAAHWAGSDDSLPGLEAVRTPGDCVSCVLVWGKHCACNVRALILHALHLAAGAGQG